MSEGRPFRGTVVHWRYQNNFNPWGGRLWVTADLCTLRSGLGAQYEIRCSDTAWVRYEKIRAARRTVISFFDRGGERIGLSFIPARPERVRRALVEAGWPVRVEYLGRAWCRRERLIEE